MIDPQLLFGGQEVRASTAVIGKWMERWAKAIQLTDADRKALGEIQIELIKGRLEGGRDLHNRPFTPYKTVPYYWYPGQKAAGATRNAITKARNRFFNAVRNKLRTKKKLKEHGVAKTGSMGVKFASYEDFKRSFGHGEVDLTFVRPPNMKNQMKVLVGRGSGPRTTMVLPGKGFLEGQDLVFSIGFTSKGWLARAHNEGLGRMPVRRFFGISETDKIVLHRHLVNRIRARLQSRRLA